MAGGIIDEKGKLTRRQLLSALVLVRMSTSVSTQQTVSPLQGRASIFHHVNIFVSNLPRSAAFYQKLGLPSTLRPIDPVPGTAAYALDFNNGSFLSLIQTSDPERVGTIDHFSIGIDNFDFERDTAAVRAAGIDPIAVDRIELLHMTDPDGIGVQMADALMQERPPLAEMEATIRSRYCSQSSAQSSPSSTLL